jgi:hypothetical protein
VGCILAVGSGEEFEVVLAGFEAELFEDRPIEEVPVPVSDCALEGEFGLIGYNVSQTLLYLCERVRAEVGAEVGWVLEPAGSLELDVVLAILGVGLLVT